MKSNFKEKNEWFEEWFDSPYYHLLYKDRDDEEAKKFITNLIDFFKPNKNNHFVDVACGKGRHALFLNFLGYQVDGFDLSPNSIDIAKKHESESLHFYTNDIRKPLKLNYYDYAFNLFTSFGYFNNKKDNQLAVNAIADSLKDNGVLVLDFMNSNKVIKNLGKDEIKVVENIDFNISRNHKDGFILKDIEFKDNDVSYFFQEKVKAISLDDFKTYFNSANLKIEAIFGNYNLDDFDIDNSDRLILVARKQ